MGIGINEFERAQLTTTSTRVVKYPWLKASGSIVQDLKMFDILREAMHDSREQSLIEFETSFLDIVYQSYGKNDHKNRYDSEYLESNAGF